MLLLLDNYDSFTYNLAQYFWELGAELAIYRNDQITVAEIEKLKPTKIVISPGPGKPKDAGITPELIQHFASRLPILGVCLGHQAIVEYFGGNIIKAPRILHGKTSVIKHNGKGLFASLANDFKVTRYHSLIAEPDSLPDCLQLSAWVDTEPSLEIMAIQHRHWPIYGVQFHPESVLTEHGHQLLNNFLKVKSC